jgi:hypothetical protein
MKTKGKTLTKRRNMKRKTMRRKGGGIKDDALTAYRTLHYQFTGNHSKGEQKDIKAHDDRVAEEERKKMDRDALKKLREDPDYTEVNDIKEFILGDSYVEFQGANEPLKKLGKFIEKKDGYPVYSGNTPISLIFDNGRLDGFYEARQSGYTDITTVHNVFKDNSNDNAGPTSEILPEYVVKELPINGGRKRKTIKTKKSRRARK